MAKLAEIEWQIHHSTNTGHAFHLNAKVGDMSLCKREMRHDGEASKGPGVFPCSFCKRKLEQ